MMPPVPTVPVQFADAAYDVTILPGLLAEAGARVREVSKAAKVAVVTDEHVGPLHLAALADSLESHGFAVTAVTLPCGEKHKSLASVGRIYDALLAARWERSAPVVGLGGGIVGDTAAFAAATVLRGVPYVAVPTSLLAMVDASVGGKTGVNHAAGKNLIGAFWSPKAVLIDPAVLSTLPDEELRAGLAECVKHDVIRDAGHFAAMERDAGRALSRDVEYLTKLVAHNVAIKAAVVRADPFERGERAHLNYGHTFGHAIEAATGHAVGHGDAVSLGMVAAGRAAVSLGMFDSGEQSRVEALLEQVGLPTGGLRRHGASADQIVAAMAGDKKVEGGRVRFVLAEAIGRVTLRDDVPAGAVREAVELLMD